MDVPEALRYTVDHEWLRLELDEAVVGITAYATEELGDIVFVELPAVGRQPREGRGLRRHRVGRRPPATCTRRWLARCWP